MSKPFEEASISEVRVDPNIAMILQAFKCFYNYSELEFVGIVVFEKDYK